ncbi:MAG: LytTR family DNA-binding domain-containing protein [Saprospiraceae bacterium]|nr:LytTR family DNA-binding domain-containing protein [Saprospiraceae bacterium]
MESINKLKCLIVEDEPIAADILKEYVAQVPFLELIAVCRDALFALDILQQQEVEVLFLDIHLPKLKGLDFLRSLERKPQTILTTAYSEYALEAFDENVIDYLLKPIGFSRFLKAVNKLQKAHPTKFGSPSMNSVPKAFHFFVVNKKKVKVFFDDILYLESLKDYTKIISTKEELLIRGAIGSVEEILPSNHFLRVHRSFVVNRQQVSAFTATQVEVGSHRLPIGRTYRSEVSRELDQL